MRFLLLLLFLTGCASTPEKPKLTHLNCTPGLECSYLIYKNALNQPYPKKIEGLTKAYEMSEHGCSGILLAHDRLQKEKYTQEDEVFVQKMRDSVAKSNEHHHDLHNCRFNNQIGKNYMKLLDNLEALRTEKIKELTPLEIENLITPLIYVHSRNRVNSPVSYVAGDLYHLVVNLPDELINDNVRFIQYKVAQGQIQLSSGHRNDFYNKNSQIVKSKFITLNKNNHPGFVEHHYKFLDSLHPQYGRKGELKEFALKGIAIKVPYILKKEGENLLMDYLHSNNLEAKEEARKLLVEAQKLGEDISKPMLGINNPNQYKKQYFVTAQQFEETLRRNQEADRIRKKRAEMVDSGQIKSQEDVNFVCNSSLLSSKRGSHNKKEEYYCEQAKLQLSNMYERQGLKAVRESENNYYKTEVGGHSQQAKDAYKKVEERSKFNNQQKMDRVREAEKKRYDKIMGR